MKILLSLFLIIITSCEEPQDEDVYAEALKDTVQDKSTLTTPEIKGQYFSEENGQQIETGNTKPPELVAFAQTLIGTPYKYGSTDPAQGFDCSGFITYVFNHFNITVPRTSKDFSNVQREIKTEEAKPGDIILFTGTDSTIREVGHMGIIVSANKNDIQFIHSSSGKANGVTVTPLNEYYLGRFVKVIRVFKQNDID